MPNEEYMRVLKRCKTAFIARNVSANGGFTYRHMQYLYFGVLPLFDNLYDPAYLWIPKEFQDKLTAKNPEELQKLIEFYDNNESERLKVLKDLKKHFQVDDWVDNWKEKLVNTELFKDYLWK
jgi:CO dehydrogenase/acetyl-CoA synthase beta subunit